VNHSLIFGLIVCSVGASALADDGPLVSAITATGPDPRFEVVQSTLLRRQTFLLDRWAGRVYVMTQSADSSNAWYEMAITDRPVVPKPAGDRFQLFYSLAAGWHVMRCLLMGPPGQRGSSSGPAAPRTLLGSFCGLRFRVTR
jgi:hypothetical protein